MTFHRYYRLVRLHQPIGIFLLWYPTAWALWLANNGQRPTLSLLLLFFLGTLLMRSAGCIINDIADRHIDRHVKRTKMRPLITGEVSLPEAFGLLLFCLLLAVIILLQLPSSCFIWALIAVAITFIYPFSKRVINMPQLVLGVAFSMGIPMAYLACGKSLNTQTGLLLLLNFLWILTYDTQYALADAVDDAQIGVNSMALALGNNVSVIVGILQILFHSLWLVILPLSIPVLIFWIAGGLILIYQQYLLTVNHIQQPIKVFYSNHYYGLIMWIALML